MKLTPEDQSRLRDKELANIIRKLNAGKTLTAREQAKLDAAAAGEGIDATGYVGTWDELATRLGVTRRAIQDWRDDPRYAPEIEARKKLLARADGRHCVAAWLGLMIDLRLKRGKAAATIGNDPENAGDVEEGLIQPPRYGGRESDWVKAKVAKEVEKKGVELDSLKGTLLEAAALEAPLGAMLATFQAKTAFFPQRVAPSLLARREVAEIEDRLRDELDADLGDLQCGAYLAPDAVSTAIAALPFDAESERLWKLVIFDGQDRTALLQLIERVATEALRQLGRRAIAHALREKDTPDTALSDPETGQVTNEAAAREGAKRQTSPAPESSALDDPARSAAPGPASVFEAAPGEPATASTPRKAPAPRGKDRRRKARPKPAPLPPEVEAVITVARHKKKPRR